MAIIAALSVQYCNCGIKQFQPFFSPSFNKPCLNPVLADTPPASLNGYTPYDTDARFGKKRDITWIGYKAHLSETCDPGEPHVIVNVLTTPAPMTDMEVTALVHQSLASRNLLPTTLLWMPLTSMRAC